MPFDWSEYLAVATEIIKRPMAGTSQEATQRVSISRAYYAAFCSARNRLRDIDKLAAPVGWSHQFVITTFQTHVDPARQAIGVDLDRMRNYRNAADYDDVVTKVAWFVAMNVLLGNQVLAEISKL